ncbi:MAG: exodeoxyribonuclease VII large subunit [Candidatus Omnitrophica bacterium]|nr:exodeoxyribonuclease VII large subunit [Candidatus Omnitrophota bacterium]
MPELFAGGAAPKRKAYTVTQLNREIRSKLEEEYASVWLEGEISNFKRHTSGHLYLSLKDDKSQIGAVFFARDCMSVRFQIRDGLKVLVYGRVSLYEARGQFQFYIQQMEPLGLGALQLAFNQLKEKLQKEGLFDVSRKRPIPVLPRRVGVVTSPTGAAIRDILNVVNRRFRGTEVLIYPVRVQGEGSAQEIARAVRELNALRSVDVMIVGRGGGSLEDLWAFNEEEVARAVFESDIPVISAVGHEVDWTICDAVADLRAPTPSAAAELVVRNREELVKHLAQMSSRLAQGAAGLLRLQKKNFAALRDSYALRQPLRRLEQYCLTLDDRTRRIRVALRNVVNAKSKSLGQAAGTLEALSPLKVLSRGYALPRSKGRVIKKAAELRAGDILEVLFADGTAETQVTRLLLKEEKK